MLFLRSNQPRHFADARGPPGRPKVDQHNFAANPRQPNPPAVEVSKRKISRRDRLSRDNRLARDLKPDWREVSPMRRPPPLGASSPGLRRFAAAFGKFLQSGRWVLEPSRLTQFPTSVFCRR